MTIYPELKIMGDSYPGGFSNGASLCYSESSGRMKEISRTDSLVTYRDDRGYDLNIHIRPVGEATEIFTEFSNSSDSPVTLEMLSSMALSGIKADKVYRMRSCWSSEGRLIVEKTTDLQLEPSWNRCATRAYRFGNLGSMPVRSYFPFIALEDSESGRFVAAQLYLASSWQMELICRQSDELTLVAGIADADFGHWTKTLKAGESFKTPRVVIAEGDSLYEVCDKLVKAQHPDISPVDNDMGIAFNEYCTTWGNPSIGNMKRIADALKGKGIKYLVMDSGWYGKGNWWTTIGDWDVNEEKFPDGLKPMCDYIRSLGMIPGIWFEYESVCYGSKHFNNAEHLLKRNGVPITVGGRRFWDFEDPWVVEYLSEKVIKLLKDNGFGYVKVDYNDTVGAGVDGSDGMGENLRRKIAAQQEFFRRIKRELPDLVIENCSSGGHRLEPSMMELASQASFSDAHETASMPIIAANLQRVIKPEQSQIWAVLRRTDSVDRLHYSLCNTFFGRLCLSGDIYDLNGEQWQAVDEGIEFYCHAAPIIKDGMTTLNISTPDSYNNPEGYQLVIREHEGRSLAVYHRFASSSEPDLSFLEGKKILHEYGEIGCDFSAKAWIYE